MWYNIVEALADFNDSVNTKLAPLSIDDGAGVAKVLQQVVEDFFPDNAEVEAEEASFAQEPSYLFNLNGISQSVDSSYISSQIGQLHELVAVAIFSGYGIEPPKIVQNLSPGASNAVQYEKQYEDIYELVFLYYYLAAAGLLFTMAFFTYIIHRKKDRYDYIHIGLRITIGFVFSMICLMKKNQVIMHKFISSPWPVPVIVIIMLVCKLHILNSCFLVSILLILLYYSHDLRPVDFALFYTTQSEQSEYI